MCYYCICSIFVNIIFFVNIKIFDNNDKNFCKKFLKIIIYNCIEKCIMWVVDGKM